MGEAKSKEIKATEFVLDVTGLNGRIPMFGGTGPFIMHGEDGNPLPDNQQLTYGKIMGEALGRMKAESGVEALLAYSLGSAILEATAGEGKFTLGAEKVAILRKALEQNPTGYIPAVLGPVWLKIGTDEDKSIGVGK